MRSAILAAVLMLFACLAFAQDEPGEEVVGPDQPVPLAPGEILVGPDMAPAANRPAGPSSSLDVFDQYGNVVLDTTTVGPKIFQIVADIAGVEAMVTYSRDGLAKKTESVRLPARVMLAQPGDEVAVFINTPGFKPNGIQFRYEERWNEKHLAVEVEDPFLAIGGGWMGIELIPHPSQFCQLLPRKGTQAIVRDRAEIYDSADEGRAHLAALFEGMFVLPIGKQPGAEYVKVVYCQGGPREGYTKAVNLRDRDAYLKGEQDVVMTEFIDRQKILVGMTRDQVLLSWGKPFRISRMRSGNEQWCYVTPPGRTFLSFDSDRVVNMDYY